MADLYRIQPNKLNWQDIEQFLHLNLPEGDTLDYKKDFSEGVPASIAAMANTRGGIIIIGVEEDTKTKKPTRVLGIGSHHYGSGTLGNHCRRLQPRYVPPHHLVEFPTDTTKGILVVRVQPEHAPVPIWDEDGGVLVRVGDQNRPADLQTLRSLLDRADNRRSPLTEAADNIINRALQAGGRNESWAVVGAIIEREDPQSTWSLEEIDRLSTAVFQSTHIHTAASTSTTLVHFWEETENVKRNVDFHSVGIVVVMFGWSANPLPAGAAILGLQAGIKLLQHSEVQRVFQPIGAIRIALGVVSWPADGISMTGIVNPPPAPRPIGKQQGRQFHRWYDLNQDTDPWSIIGPFMATLLTDGGYRVHPEWLAKAPADAALMRSGDFGLP